MSDGCERLARALNSVAAKHGLDELQVVAVPLHLGEAAVSKAYPGSQPDSFVWLGCRAGMSDVGEMIRLR